jgi:DNA-binding transcriptional ArsR family regulator
MEAAGTDLALRALAHDGRRTALRLLQGGEHTSGQVAEVCGWARPAASQHLAVLKEAGLVDVRIDGNRRVYRARTAALAELRRFLDDFWDDRLGSLADHVHNR